ncbi:MAG: class I SAM-dependent DNA methyltransferase [Bacteroidota bacterium]
MITGPLKRQVDQIWSTFWSSGISNPLTVIEQLSYLLFIKRLDDIQTRRERQAQRTGTLDFEPVFGPDEQHLRWSRFKQLPPEAMLRTVQQDVFPFIKTLGQGDDPDTTGSTYAKHMEGAVFMIADPALLARTVERMDGLDLDDRDTKGDLYEYMLSKLSTSGQNGQFRTPRHIIKLMVDLVAPRPTDTICDPACGTAGFLVAAGEYLRDHYPDLLLDVDRRAHFHERAFTGYDFDATMLRIGSMNMMLHGVENPHIEHQDTLADTAAHLRDRFSLVLANPPFTGSLDYERTAKDLQAGAKTRKTELLFMRLILRLLEPGGRAAVIVPDGVLFGSTKAHKAIREELVERHQLDAVVSMPSGVFKPYAGVSTAILLFTKTGTGGTEGVWFYEMTADGFSLDDKRQPVDENDLPDLLTRWQDRAVEVDRPRTAQSFVVPKAEIAEQSYDLSFNRYREVEYEAVEYDPPAVILTDLRALEQEIQDDLDALEALIA